MRVVLLVAVSLELGTGIAIASPITCMDFTNIDGSLKRPERPMCVAEMYSPIDDFVFNDCRREMEDYRSKIKAQFALARYSRIC